MARKKLIRPIIIASIFFTLFIIALNLVPAFPLQSVDYHDAIAKLKGSPTGIVKLTVENNSEWYFAKMDKGKGYEKFIHIVEQKGWKFETKEGSGYFFYKDGNRLIGSCQMWTSKYILCKLPVV